MVSTDSDKTSVSEMSVASMRIFPLKIADISSKSFIKCLRLYAFLLITDKARWNSAGGKMPFCNM